MPVAADRSPSQHAIDPISGDDNSVVLSNISAPPTVDLLLDIVKEARKPSIGR